MSISAMKQALEALELGCTDSDGNEVNLVTPAITALRQAIAEAEKQEPMIFHVHKSAIDENNFKQHVNFYLGPAPSEDFVTLYTAPPKREWVGLTHEERDEIDQASRSQMEALFAIEAKLKEKNCG